MELRCPVCDSVNLTYKTPFYTCELNHESIQEMDAHDGTNFLIYVGGFPSIEMLVNAEIARAVAKHGPNFANAHTAYAVILEEVEEFWDLVREQDPDPDKMIAELVQIAATAMKFAEQLQCRQ